VLLGYLVPDWLAILISVLVVLIAGEIIPAALFTGPNQLKVAAQFSLLVYFLEGVFFPIAYPVAALLDCYFGVESEESMTRDEISAMLKILYSNSLKKGDDLDDDDNDDDSHNHGDENSPLVKHNGKHRSKDQKHTESAHKHDHHDHKQKKKSSSHSKDTKDGDKKNALVPTSSTGVENDKELSSTEIAVITGVLGLAKKTIYDTMINISNVTSISSQKTLDKETLQMIKKMRHSRLVVFKDGDRSTIEGILHVKDLISYGESEQNFGSGSHPKVSSVPLVKPHVVNAEASLLDVLHYMHASGAHIALVSSDPFKLLSSIESRTSPLADFAPLGIISIEDILSQIITMPSPDSSTLNDENARILIKSEKLKTSESLKSLDGSPPRALSPVKTLPGERAKSLRLSILESALLGVGNNADVGSGEKLYPLPLIASTTSSDSRSTTPENLLKFEPVIDEKNAGAHSVDERSESNSQRLSRPEQLAAALSERLILPSKESTATRPAGLVRLDSRRRKESIDNLDLKDIL